MSLSANQWTEKATFPKNYGVPSCVLGNTDETVAKEICCLGANDESLMVYNVDRDEWREGEIQFFISFNQIS